MANLLGAIGAAVFLASSFALAQQPSSPQQAPGSSEPSASTADSAAANAGTPNALSAATDLVSTVRRAYSDIRQARGLLHPGIHQRPQAKTLLTRAADDLKTVRRAIPSSARSQLSSAIGGLEQRGTGAASSEAPSATSASSPLERAYQTVVAARDSVVKNKLQRARQLLDQVPSLAQVESSLAGVSTGVGGSGR